MHSVPAPSLGIPRTYAATLLPVPWLALAELQGRCRVGRKLQGRYRVSPQRPTLQASSNARSSTGGAATGKRTAPLEPQGPGGEGGGRRGKNVAIVGEFVWS